MYTWAKVTSAESSGHHLSARCSVWWQPAFRTTRGSRGPSRAHRHLSLSLWEKSVLDASRYHRYIPLLSMPILRVDPTPFLAQFFLSSFLLTFGGPKLKAWWAPAETKLPSAAHTAKGTQECLWPVAHRCKIRGLLTQPGGWCWKWGRTRLAFHWTQRPCW